MTVGTKSVLFGVHAFWFHWLPVTLAWRHLYGRYPRWWEFVAIVVHDLGYFGKPNMDGPEGETHPEEGAWLAGQFVAYFREDLWAETHDLALHHSRYYAAHNGAEPSRLCWADKLSVWFEPEWFYLLRATLSGEIIEYMRNAPAEVQSSPAAWLHWYKARAADVAMNRIKAKSRYV